MNNISLSDLQKHLLQMMKSFHDFCINNNIKYYMVGGTALGAKRHKGFIPWDDDVDIAIPRDDYDRLFSLLKKLPSNLEVLCFKTLKHTPFHYIKLVDKNTTLVEKYYPDSVEGLYIDVFPLDGAFSRIDKDIRRRKKVYRMNQIIVFHYANLENPSLKEKIIQMVSRFARVDSIHEKLDCLMKSVAVEEGDSMANLLGAYSEKEVVDKSYFGVPQLYDFEDTQFYGPENIEQYLQTVYGDYMKLPDPEHRIAKHGYLYLDLEMPYSEFGGLIK